MLFGKKTKKTTVAGLRAEREGAQAAASEQAASAAQGSAPASDDPAPGTVEPPITRATAARDAPPVDSAPDEGTKGGGSVKMLQARGLVKNYRGRNVVNRVNIHVRTGEIVGLLGPNGAGKTTTFYMVIGLVTPTDGQVLLDGEDITRLPIYKRARKGIGYLAQESSVFKKLSVEENILLVWEARGVPDKEQREMLLPLLEEFKIDHIRKQKCFVLSGGERRRTEVARALAGNPDFIMLDEPFTGIDPVTIESLKDIIGGLRDRGLGVLITDHNVRETLAICDRAYIIMDGQVLVEGTPQEVAANSDARKYFLGEQFKLD
jgi:lipopolysaccharide export system ATP-binding protein